MSFSPHLIALTLAISPTLHAEPSVIVTLATLPERVHAQNPDLAAARIRIQEAVARVQQAGRLSNPELQFSMEQNKGFNEGRVELGIAQRFPLTDRLARERELSMTQVTIAESEVREVERRLVAQARTALIEVLSLRQRRNLLVTQAKVSAELADSIHQAADKGEGSLLDASQAKIEALRVATEARQLDAREAAAVGSLKPLLGMTPAQGLVISGSLPPVTEPAANTTRRPDLQTAALEIDAAAKAVAVEESRRYDDIEAGIFAAGERSEDAPIGSRDEALIGLQLKIPLPFWNRNEGEISEAKARHQRKQLEHRALARSINLEAATARNEMREWSALAKEIATKLLPLADTQATDTETAWRNGQTTLLAVLKAREQRLQLAASHIDATREFHLAAARYLAAIGQP